MERAKKLQLVKTTVSACLMLSVMIVIFVFSHQRGEVSSGNSNSVGEWIVGILKIEIPEGETASSVPIFAGLSIRKCAHIFLYMLLGATSFLFADSLVWLIGIQSGRALLYATLGAFAISFLYACFDEWHQWFVGGRTATVRDVGIDAIGFSIAIALCVCVRLLIVCLRRKGRRAE